ncbi:MAG: sulfite exporter TauE/SafE family protein [Oscillospiraceae bacterium]|nr:sulfite exporter TauE/SafE family protein [Oscillospiraceae bacterium]
MKKSVGFTISGICAGAVNGLFGAGGGMILVPLLTWLTPIDDGEVFPSSVTIILPICLVSLSFTLQRANIDAGTTLCYLAGSVIGGLLAGILAKKIPNLWLHRILGIFILWGGIRYLC